MKFTRIQTKRLPTCQANWRPAVIVQDDHFDATASVTVRAFMTDPTEAELFRLRVEPRDRNGLREISRLMIDRVTTIPKSKLGSQIGRFADADVVRLNRAMMVFLGPAGSPGP